ncbi:hypothetical protein [Mycetocola sp. JXN-3]|uniref:hypothetical protein n=1 Tax=Mycetocola sp. JXN-3 TaxID=2116510 RepID=UPI00165CFD5A|nr:hypothetical protein [Mycetocola sp. JXN-3]
MPIAFENGAADMLIESATSAATILRGQGAQRRGSVEDAVVDFSGGYATLFTEAGTSESEDRGGLAGAFNALADQVRDAKTKAQQERDRLKKLSEWKARDAARREANTTSFGLVMPVPLSEGLLDPRPSEYPIAPPTISTFASVRSRTRTAAASAEGRSSADPERLRRFVTQSRAGNTAMESEFTRVNNAWSRFVGSCSWGR